MRKPIGQSAVEGDREQHERHDLAAAKPRREGRPDYRRARTGYRDVGERVR